MPRSARTREALLWSKGLGVGNWQTKTFLSLGIKMVRFPGLNWHRRAKVPLQLSFIIADTSSFNFKHVNIVRTNKKTLELCSKHARTYVEISLSLLSWHMLGFLLTKNDNTGSIFFLLQCLLSIVQGLALSPILS